MAKIRSRELRVLAKRAQRKGWQLVRTKRHFQLISPDEQKVTFPGTTGDRRAWLNMRADLRRAGLDV